MQCLNDGMNCFCYAQDIRALKNRIRILDLLRVIILKNGTSLKGCLKTNNTVKSIAISAGISHKCSTFNLKRSKLFCSFHSVISYS